MNEDQVIETTLNEQDNVEVQETPTEIVTEHNNHAVLNGRELNDQHPISAITGLKDRLEDIESVKRVYSLESGLGEFRRWKVNKAPEGDPSGYFVTIVSGSDDIEVCDATHDVYGITVKQSGFVGNQTASDQSDNPLYAIVGIVGAMRVRTDGTAHEGDYVVPSVGGIATLSKGEYGYKVLSVGSISAYEYVTIAITPQSDALSRLQDSLNGEGGLSDIILQINQTNERIDGLQIQIDESMSEEAIRDIVNENISNLEDRVTTAESIVAGAVADATTAKDLATQTSETAAQAVQDAQAAREEAIQAANNAVAEAQAAREYAETATGEAKTFAETAANDAKAEAEAAKQEVTGIKTDVDSIRLTVNDHTGNISTINTEIDNINSTIETVNGNLASVQVTANENASAIMSLAQGQFDTVYESHPDENPPVAYDNLKYSAPPTWNEEEGRYYFDESTLDENGQYYFTDENVTTYCKVAESGYDMYMRSNEYVAFTNTRIDDNGARIDQLAQANTELGENIASISAKADDNGSRIDQLVEADTQLAENIASVSSKANENSASITQLVASNNQLANDIANIKIEAGKDGTSIQHLVAHIDQYAIGDYSPTYGLSYEEAKDLLTKEHIYVPISDHKEIMSGDPDIVTHFKCNDDFYYYTWIPYDGDDTGKWVKSDAPISTAPTYEDGTAVGDLWYCWQYVDVLDEDGEIVETFEADVLYRWYGSQWIAVASVNENYQNCIVTSVKQTADSIRSDVVSLDGKVSSVEQNVNSIITRVADAEGDIAQINIEIGTINQTVSDVDGTVSSLQQRADTTEASLDLIAIGVFPKVEEFIGSAPEPYDGKKYTLPPVWNEVEQAFEFNVELESEDGAYYFDTNNQKRYCHALENGYEIYIVETDTLASINTRVGKNESSISALSTFKETTNERINELDASVKTTTESLAGITERVDANEASITALATRYRHILLSVSTTEISAYGSKYTEEPEWNAATGKYEFTGNPSVNGTYYLIDENATRYCHVVTLDDDTKNYEIYGLGGSSVAALEQKVNENSSSIGLVVEKTDAIIDDNGNLKDEALSDKGSIIIEAINDETTATINADRIKLTATDSITLYVAGAKQEVVNEATALANTAESNAKGYTDTQLESYSTTTEVESKIEQKAESITSTVSSTYATKTEAGNLANTAQANAESTAANLANTAESNAKADTAEKLTSYSTTAQMNSAITQKANEITSSVSATYATKDSLGGYATTTQLSEIKQQVDTNGASIGLLVKDGEASGELIISAINGTESSAKISADRVEINADSIDLSAHEMFSAVVDDDGSITPASIVAAINEDESEIAISADKIILTTESTLQEEIDSIRDGQQSTYTNCPDAFKKNDLWLYEGVTTENGLSESSSAVKEAPYVSGSSPREYYKKDDLLVAIGDSATYSPMLWTKYNPNIEKINASCSMIIDNEQVTINNGNLVINNNDINQILLNPDDGIKIQKKSGDVWEDQFYADDDGNLILKGNLAAAGGSFTGTVSVESEQARILIGPYNGFSIINKNTGLETAAIRDGNLWIRGSFATTAALLDKGITNTITIDPVYGIKIQQSDLYGNTIDKLSIDVNGDLVFQGKISGVSGDFGGWEIDTDGITSPTGIAELRSTGVLKMGQNDDRNIYIDSTGIFSVSFPSWNNGQHITCEFSHSSLYDSFSGLRLQYHTDASTVYPKLMLGLEYNPDNINEYYPALQLGVGENSSYYKGYYAYSLWRGLIKKHTDGLWIGLGDLYKPNSATATYNHGLLFTQNTIWVVKNGSWTELGSGGSSVAVFG